jgi:hypothetical protein
MANTLTPATVLQPGKPYNVRQGTARNNAAAWQAVQAALAANGGTATVAQLQAALQPLNNTPFVQYLVRRAWLVPVKAPAPAASKAHASK